MPRHKSPVSYYHIDRAFLDELVPVVQTVPSIGDVLWFDEQDFRIGDVFPPQIQQALAGSRIGILLFSNQFFTSEYIRQHELPYLLQQGEHKALTLISLYVTAIPNDGFNVTLEVDGQQCTIDLQGYLRAHTPREPLNILDRGKRDKIYARLANWVAQQLAVTTGIAPRRIGQCFELAITTQARHSNY
jgi:hypothetical protein